VFRVIPSVPVEVRQGVCVMAAAEPQDGQDEVEALFAELGTLVTVADGLVDAAMGLMSCAPAFYALVAEAQVDAGVRHGLTPDDAAAMVGQTMAGTAALLARGGHDTLALRRSVTSPGGTTARGLDALERGGLRAAFSDALDAVLQTGRHRP
jgi:pyrroline-5-carboxylate reductase